MPEENWPNRPIKELPKMPTTSDIGNLLKAKLKNKDFVIDKTGVKTIEVMGQSFIADEPAIFGTVNQDYVKREIEWYKSQSLYVADIPGGAPKIWQQVASSEGKINSNYGWCIFSKENGNQYDYVLADLKKNIYSRRAEMIYTRPTMHTDYCVNGMSDFCCTEAVQYLYRDDKLNAIVKMRSNDAVFGYKNDKAWADEVLRMLCNDLNVQAGDIVWNAGSLHVYERHFNLVDPIAYPKEV